MKATETTEEAARAERVQFWVSMFKPRTKKWQRDTLRELKAGKNILETPEENANKRAALKILLSQ